MHRTLGPVAYVAYRRGQLQRPAERRSLALLVDKPHLERGVGSLGLGCFPGEIGVHGAVALWLLGTICEELESIVDLDVVHRLGAPAHSSARQIRSIFSYP